MHTPYLRRNEPTECGPSAPAAETVSESHRIGQIVANKYGLHSVLGRGGMGAVWLARNLNLDVDVAIKLIRSDIASRGTSWKRERRRD